MGDRRNVAVAGGAAESGVHRRAEGVGVDLQRNRLSVADFLEPRHRVAGKTDLVRQRHRRVRGESRRHEQRDAGDADAICLHRRCHPRPAGFTLRLNYCGRFESSKFLSSAWIESIKSWSA